MKVFYTPPPERTGTVTIEMSMDEASALLALVGYDVTIPQALRENGEDEDEVRRIERLLDDSDLYDNLYQVVKGDN